MAGDSEKRFQNVMDKLYLAPKPKPSLSRGKKVESGTRAKFEDRLRLPTAGMGSVGSKPQCRPWDRGDLMKRLATFKAMTWFGKPKAVSPISCARRGWISVETDTIVCEACGARLLFSTPLYWTLQQVEKAAAVFSLKLDNGHKLLCPWIDNACDEKLALFPPTPPPTLVEGYKKRFSALSRLSALPTISSSALDYMKSSQLEHLLSKSSHPSIALDNGIRLTEGSKNEDLESASQAVTANLYYQAQKIISICGWEPRLLPYAVDCEDHSSSFPSAYPSESPTQILGEQNDSLISYSSSGPGEVEQGNDVDHPLGGHQFDPASVVLDCRLCGACVGLWAFATTPRPLELFSLTVSPGSSGQKDTPICGADIVSGVEAPRTQNLGKADHDSSKGNGDTGCTGTAAKETPFRLSLTIAGGPLPTKQDFRPRVSFPVVSRHLRAGLGSDSGSRNSVSCNVLGENQVNTPCFSQDDDSSQHQKDMDDSLAVCSKGAGALKRKRSGEFCISRSSDMNAHSQLNGEPDGMDNSLVIVEKSGDTSSERMPYIEQGLLSMHEGCIGGENSKDFMQNRHEDLCRGDAVSEDAEKGKAWHAEREACVSDKVGESSCAIMNVEACENNSARGSSDVCNHHDDSFSGVDSLHHGETSETNHHDTSHIASCSAANTTLSAHNVNSEKGSKGCDFQNFPDARGNNLTVNGSNNMVVSPVNREVTADHASGNNPKLVLEFDPIRQHRPFCPWIAPMDGKSMPGWKLTLSALDQEKDSSHSVHLETASTLSDEVDDPIISVRRLFMSPPAKRLKGTHQSS